MKTILLTLLFAAFAATSSAQGVNMSLIGHIDYQALHNTDLNDCWGYVDETGIEYALVGTTDGTSIVSLADPANPTEVYWLPGPHSVWRDLQVYEDYLYVTTEAQHGMEIIDMSPLPGSAVLTNVVYTGPVGNQWATAHDVFVDTAGGWAYILGAGRGNGGTIILDIHTDPMAPIEVADIDNWYTHDAFAQGNLLYNAHINDGFFSIFDVTDHANPVLINTQYTPTTFTHNIWVTPDDHYAVTGDETQGGYYTVYDVSNPNAIQELDRIRSSPGMSIVPHNAFITEDSLFYAAYYTDGVRVYDMRRPHNVVEVASYDTHPNQNNLFQGCWGTYPYLPSGLILGSDMQMGLFVLQSDALAAGWYEGLVRDANTLAALPDALVTIENDPQSDLTNAQGNYAIGTGVAGTLNVTFSKGGYQPQVIPVTFASGVLLTDTIDLVPLPSYDLTVIVQDAATGDPIIDAAVSIEFPLITHTGATNGFGESAFDLYYDDEATVTAGKWGYLTACDAFQLDETTGTITIQLDKGWYDDFTFDFGWTTTSSGATSGLWERGRPNGAPGAPGIDVVQDCGHEAYVTGNDPLAAYEDDDVEGTVTLISPLFDIAGYADPFLKYRRWFYCGDGALPDDALNVFLSNGSEQVLIEGHAGTPISAWVPKTFRISDFITPTATMQLVVTTTALGVENLTEAGLDLFSIIDGGSGVGLEELKGENRVVWPNPVREVLYVSGEGNCRILSAQGMIVQEAVLSPEQSFVDVSGLANGIYLLEVNGGIVRFVKE